MNERIEEMGRIANAISKLNEKERTILDSYLKNNIESFNQDPTSTVEAGIKFVVEQLVMEVIKFSNENTKKLHDALNSDDEDTNAKTIYSSQNMGREKAFVEAMSSPLREQEQLNQQKRNERYEEMISESAEIESPISRRHR